MADQQVADQLEFWDENLAISIKEVQIALKEGPVNLSLLEEAFGGMQIDLGKVQLYQVNPKVKVAYDYKKALPNIASALRLE